MISFRSLNSTSYNAITFDFIKNAEGCRSDLYNDGQGIATIGLGYNLRDDTARLAVLNALTGNNIPQRLDGAIEAIVDNPWSDTTTVSQINSVLIA